MIHKEMHSPLLRSCVNTIMAISD